MVLFREVNERIKVLNERLARQIEGGEWLCECVPDFGVRAFGDERDFLKAPRWPPAAD